MELRTLNRLPKESSVIAEVQVLHSECGAALELLPREEGGCRRAHAPAPGLIDTHMQASTRACTVEQFLAIARFEQRNRHRRFKLSEFVARHLLRIAFCPGGENHKLVIRQPNKWDTPWASGCDQAFRVSFGYGRSPRSGSRAAEDARTVIETVASRERQQSLGEEIANSVSHGLALLAAVIAVPLLVVGAVQRGYAAGVVGASVFATTMVLLYLASTLYHALPRNRAKQVFRLLDRGAIYLLIAGTYTPFTLGVLGGAWGWTLLGLVWGLAVVGVISNAIGGVRFPKLSVCLYLAMGWLVLVAAKPLVLNLPAWGLFWLLAGGIAYTTGIVFYSAKQLRYGHFVWHLFVIVGTTCHFIAVQWYAA